MNNYFSTLSILSIKNVIVLSLMWNIQYRSVGVKGLGEFIEEYLFLSREG